MPTLRVLTTEEVDDLIGGKEKDPTRLLIQQEYDALIAEVRPGDYATVELAEDEDKVNVRNRIKAAAKRRGLTATFRRTRDNTIIFRLEEVT